MRKRKKSKSTCAKQVNKRIDKQQEHALEIWSKKLGNRTAIAKEIGVSRWTLTMWLREDAKFVERVNEAEETKKDFIESKLFQKINEGDTRAIIFGCETQLRDRGYGKKLDIKNDVTHSLDEESKQRIDKILEENEWT